jgi:prevent-host-death family protein
MVKTISAWEARRNFGKLLNEVSGKQRTIFIESHGEPKSAMVPVSVAEAYERERHQFFDTARAIAARIDVSEEEAMEVALAEVAAQRAAVANRTPSS